MRTSNLAVIANAMESNAKTESSYKQIQRFLKTFKWRQSGFAEFQLELPGISGKLDLLIDRTEWKFGIESGNQNRRDQDKRKAAQEKE